jgi:hypothetical protein
MAGCPHCGADLDGYVEMGSVGYQRVSKGCCPHCGRYVSGLGFEKTPPRPRSISNQEYEHNYVKSLGYASLDVYMATLGGFSIMAIAGLKWWGIIVGVIYLAVFSFFGWLYYSLDYVMFRSYNESDLKSPLLHWAITGFSLFLYLFVVLRLSQQVVISEFWKTISSIVGFLSVILIWIPCLVLCGSALVMIVLKHFFE